MALSTQCKLAYDFLNSGIPEWWYPFAGAVAAAFAYLVYKAYVRWAPDAIQRLSGPKLGLAGAWLAIAFFSIYFPARNVLSYYDLKTMVVAHRSEHVEGPVAEYRPFVSKTESFSVCGKTFVVQPDSDNAGFNLVRGIDSPIRKGAYVKIDYVGRTIVRLEICPTLPSNCRLNARTNEH